jgi:hypothetical protein
MGRRAAELAGVLVASIFVSFVTDLATTGSNDALLYVVGALVPLALLVAYWLWIEPRAEANRITAMRLHRAVDDAFELTHPQTDTAVRHDDARRDFYDRLDISDLFEPNHLEAASVLGEAHDSGQALLHRLDDGAEPSAELVADVEAWQDRTGHVVERARGTDDATAFRMPSGHAAVGTASDRLKTLDTQVQLLEVWSGMERKRAADQAKERYR